MSMKTKGILLAAGGASLWGGSGAAAQQLFMTHAVTTEWLVAVRLLGAGLLLLIWGLIKSSKQIDEIIHDRKNMAMVLAFAIFGVMNSQLSYFFALTLLSPKLRVAPSPLFRLNLNFLLIPVIKFRKLFAFEMIRSLQLLTTFSLKTLLQPEKKAK